MKVLCVHPSGLMYTEIFLRLEPLGLECVAAAIRKAGHEVPSQLAGARAEIEHFRIDRQLELAHNELDQLLRPPRPAELVLVSRVPERVGRGAALSQRPQATECRLGGAG